MFIANHLVTDKGNGGTRTHSLYKALVLFALAFVIALIPGFAFAAEKTSATNLKPQVEETADSAADTIVNDYKAKLANKEVGSTDFDKALYVHNVLFDNKFDPNSSYSDAEGVLLHGEGNSQSFHEAYALVLKKLNIETRDAKDITAGKSWTLAKLDGNWTHIDVANDAKNRAANASAHLYFGLTDAQIKIAHSGYNSTGNPQASSTANSFYVKTGGTNQDDSLKSEIDALQKKIKTAIDSKPTENLWTVLATVTSGSVNQTLINSHLASCLNEKTISGTKIGSIKVSVTYNASVNNYTVKPAQALITESAVTNIGTKTYNGKSQTQNVQVVVGGKTLKAGTDYDLVYRNAVNAGTATVTITGKGDYAGVVTKEFTIRKASISSAQMSGFLKTVDYTGYAIKQNVTLTHAGRTLTSNDYSIAYKNNTAIGMAEMEITGKGNYEGSVKYGFQIKKTTTTKKDLAASTITSSNMTRTATGKPLGPSVTVKHRGTLLKQGTDYYLTYNGSTSIPSKAGTYTVRAVGKGDYTGAKNVGTFKLISASAKWPLSDVQVTTANMARLVTGKPLAPSVTLKREGITLKQGTDYYLTYNGSTTTPKNAGTYVLRAVGKGKYSGTRSLGTYTLSKSLLNATVSTSGLTRNYTGKALAPTVVLKDGKTTLKQGTDYYLTYNNSKTVPKKVGTYTVRAVGKGKYSGVGIVDTFKIVKGPSVNSKTQVRIMSTSNSNFVLDAAGASPKIGANISIWNDNYGANQKWYLVLGSDGYYTIRSASNQSFYIDAAGTKPKVGANASIWKKNGGLNQKWTVEPSTNGSYVIRSAANPKLVLDAAGSSPKRGANVSVWTSNGGKNQKWKIVAVTAASFDSKKTYEISSLSNSTFVLDAAGQKPSIGANVSIWTSNGGKNQKWQLASAGNGYYYICSASNKNFVLDAAGRSPHAGSNVSIWKKTGSLNQKWRIEKLANGAYIIRNAANKSLVLDAAGSSPKRGANISAWTSNGGANQKWRIKAVS